MNTPAFSPGILILAAGASRRMGRPKLLLPWNGSTVAGSLIALYRSITDAHLAMAVDPADRALNAELDRLGFPLEDRIVNPCPSDGMFSSIRIGLAWPGWEPSVTHVVIALGDQPHLKPETVRQLIAAAKEHPTAITQPFYQGRARHPVVLPRAAAQEIVTGNSATLREALAISTFEIHTLQLSDSGLSHDIDTPEDFAFALNHLATPTADGK